MTVLTIKIFTEVQKNDPKFLWNRPCQNSPKVILLSSYEQS